MIRELSYFKVSAGVGGASNLVASHQGVSNIFGKIAKHLMGCEMFGIKISDSNKNHSSFTTKVISVTAIFIKQRRHHLR